MRTVMRYTSVSLGVLLISNIGLAASAAMPPTLNPPAIAKEKVSAANPAVSGNPAGSAGHVPIVKWLRSQGAALTPLGLTGGLAGFLVQKNGHSQTVYVTPDGKHVVAGIMAGIGGSDVTALQLEALVITHGHKADAKFKAPSTVSTPTEGSSTSKMAVASGAVMKDPVPTAKSKAPDAPTPVTKQTTVDTASPAVADQASISDPGGNATELPKLTQSKFDAKIKDTANFTVGYPHLPDVVIVADPTCPVCHASWTLLAPLVKSRKIDVTVILIDLLPNSTTPAVDLLANPAIGQAWLQGQGSQYGVAIPPVTKAQDITAAKRYLKDNERFAYSAKIESTPTVFWRATDGHIYRGVGLKGVAGFLTAVENHTAAALPPPPPARK